MVGVPFVQKTNLFQFYFLPKIEALPKGKASIKRFLSIR